MVVYQFETSQVRAHGFCLIYYILLKYIACFFNF
ncbi:unnamed protein product, partial [Vitis vinifera]|uniref:Uncharacterized protein n=1 Tax=Vitis vinifera TaxID=29760 RepID=D7U4I1_VITVI